VFRFGESLTQEVAYESLLLRERRRLHGEFARHLEQTRRDSSPERATLLAHHYARSEDRARAVRALLVAAIEAESVPDYAAMVRFHAEAWQLAREWLDAGGEKGDADVRAALEAAIGAARAHSFGASVAGDVGSEAFERGSELARRLEDPVALAELLSLRGSALTNGDPEAFAEGVRLLEQSCEVAQDAGQVLATLRVSRLLAFAYLLDARLEDALPLFDEVIAGFEDLGHRESLSDAYLGALTYRDRALYYARPNGAAQAVAEQTLGLAERARNRTVQSASASKLARLALDAGDLERALALALPAMELSEEIGNRGGARTAAAVAALAQAELKGAVHAGVQQALERVTGAGFDVAAEGDLVSEALIACGRETEALEMLRAARAGCGGRLRATLCDLGYARAVARAADLELAASLAESALEHAERQGLVPIIAGASVLVAEIALELGERERAVAVLSHALEAARERGLGRAAEHATRLLARIGAESARRDLH
jgi:tetratricopeptide (TPR) repeat protein